MRDLPQPLNVARSHVLHPPGRNRKAPCHSVTGWLVPSEKEMTMLKWLIRRRLDAFQRKYDYNVDYARDILEADTTALLRFGRLEGLSVYRRDIPLDVYYAVKLIGTLTEDCGPCTQLTVAMALHDGVAPRTIAGVLEGNEAALGDDIRLRAPRAPPTPRPTAGVLEGNEAALGDDIRLGVQFARATLAHDPAADELRDAIVARWGRRALVS